MSADAPITLGEALPKEMERVTGLIEIYASLPRMAGAIAVGMMRADLKRATEALASGDVHAMMQAYKALKDYKE
jgi:hypothetical protein